MRKFLIPAMLTTALVCSPLAFAAGNPPAASAGAKAEQHHMHRGRHHMKLLDQLDLTDTQRTSIRRMFRQNFEQARPEMKALRQKERAFENATPGTASYQTQTNGLAQAESNAAHARVLRQAALRTRIYNVLTPAQRTKLAGIRKQREARIAHWHESHMHGTSAPAASSHK